MPFIRHWCIQQHFCNHSLCLITSTNQFHTIPLSTTTLATCKPNCPFYKYYANPVTPLNPTQPINSLPTKHETTTIAATKFLRNENTTHQDSNNTNSTPYQSKTTFNTLSSHSNIAIHNHNANSKHEETLSGRSNNQTCIKTLITTSRNSPSTFKDTSKPQCNEHKDSLNTDFVTKNESLQRNNNKLTQEHHVNNEIIPQTHQTTVSHADIEQNQTNFTQIQWVTPKQFARDAAKPANTTYICIINATSPESSEENDKLSNEFQ